MTWIIENAGTIFVGVLVLGAMGMGVKNLLQPHKGGGCSSCPSCNHCHASMREHKCGVSTPRNNENQMKGL